MTTFSFVSLSQLKNSTPYINILKLAVPAIVSGIAEPLIGSTDLVLVGKNTLNGIAVVGIGGSAILSIIWVLASFLSPLSARAAHLYGKDGIEGSDDTAQIDVKGKGGGKADGKGPGDGNASSPALGMPINSSFQTNSSFLH